MAVKAVQTTAEVVVDDRLEINKLTPGTVVFADHVGFSNVSTLYVKKAAFKDYYELHGDWPKAVIITVTIP